jgi:hypothetical protein
VSHISTPRRQAFTDLLSCVICFRPMQLASRHHPRAITRRRRLRPAWPRSPTCTDSRRTGSPSTTRPTMQPRAPCRRRSFTWMPRAAAGASVPPSLPRGLACPSTATGEAARRLLWCPCRRRATLRRWRRCAAAVRGGRVWSGSHSLAGGKVAHERRLLRPLHPVSAGRASGLHSQGVRRARGAACHHLRVGAVSL